MDRGLKLLLPVLILHAIVICIVLHASIPTTIHTLLIGGVYVTASSLNVCSRQ